MLLTLPCLMAAGLAAASPAAPGSADTSAALGRSRLVFTASGAGEFSFDTGVLRGKLRPGGKALGLVSVVHLPTGLQLDQGPSGYGLLSHYRVFTVGKRYGTGAWDWPSQARLQPDGSVETIWLADGTRPFEMRAIYRLAGPATVDLETVVTPNTNLWGFESFVASYFAPAFSNAAALLADHPTGSRKPDLLEADRFFGDWLLFPRDVAILALVNDGRWRLEPHPVDWTIMPPLAKPLGLRRAPASKLMAVLMAPAGDCFALAMPYQTEPHLSLYLSLFGRNLKAGETVRAHSRLVVTPDLTVEQLLQLYQNYLSELRARR